ncbi:RNA-directed DNA polymerase, eukaryota [Tanacetum coccineum]
MYALEESKSISVADKLGLSSLYLSFRRPPRGGIEQESFNLLCQSVRGLVLSNIEDRWSWSLEGSGLFSVKSSRAYIDDLLLPKADAATRWIRILPIKINVFAWKVCLDALPTRCNMSLRGIDIPSILCPLCNRAVENSDHIFFSCSMVRKVWRRLLTWWELDVSSFHSYNEWISWLSSIRLPKLLKVFLEGSCYVMWWLVWKFRNRLLFSDPTSKPDSLFDDVVQMSFLWMNSRGSDMQAHKCYKRHALAATTFLMWLPRQCRVYVGGHQDIFDMVDIELFTIVALNMMVVNLGYTCESEPLFYNYLRPLTSLDEGLYALACEEDVHCLSTLSRSFKLIDAYIEHSVTALDCYIRPTWFKATIEDITDEPGSIAANRTEKMLLLTWHEFSEPTKKHDAVVVRLLHEVLQLPRQST